MKITAAVVPARSAPFEIQTLDLAAPQPDEVLVRIVASGMCHTDLHARDGYFPNLPDPIVLSFPWCGECEPCRAARPSYCVAGRALKSSGRRTDGSTPMSRDGAPV